MIFLNKKTVEAVKNFTVSGLLGLAILTAGEYIDLRFIQGADHWVEYGGLYPAKAAYEVGEPLEMISISEVKRKVDVEWADILECYDEKSGKFTYISFYQSKRFQAPRWERQERSWVYNGEQPRVPTICRIESNVQILLPYGITKNIKVVSEPFRFKHEESTSKL